jgi:hypothetical protein
VVVINMVVRMSDMDQRSEEISKYCIQSTH